MAWSSKIKRRVVSSMLIWIRRRRSLMMAMGGSVQPRGEQLLGFLLCGRRERHRWLWTRSRKGRIDRRREALHSQRGRCLKICWGRTGLTSAIHGFHKKEVYVWLEYRQLFQLTIQVVERLGLVRLSLSQNISRVQVQTLLSKYEKAPHTPAPQTAKAASRAPSV